jgi:hypothetical protein
MRMNMKFSDVPLQKFGDTLLMTGAIYSGDGQSYVLYFPDSRDDGNEQHVDMSVDDWSALLKQTDLVEVEVLVKAGPNGELVKAMLRKSSRAVDTAVSWKVFKRDHYACRYCGNDNVALTVDHLVTWEDGGPWTEANLVSACKKCNKIRGNLPYAEWLKHPRYLQVSAKLSEMTKHANRALVETLDKIPRVVHIRSR